MSPFDIAHTTSYSTLIEAMHLSCTVFEIQPAICRKSPILTHPTCIWRPAGDDPGRILRRSLASENQSPWAIVSCCLCNPTFSRFSRTPTCEGWMEQNFINLAFTISLTRSSAIAEDDLEDAPSSSNRAKCHTSVRRLAFDKSCIRRMTFKVIQGYWKWHKLIGHMIVPNGGVQ